MRDNKPEVDPELIAMEMAMAPSAAAYVVAEADKKRETDPNMKHHGPKGKTESMGRRERRARRIMKPTMEITGRTHARIGRAKPVKSEMQRGIEMRRALREELSRMKLVTMIKDCPEIRFVAGVPGFRTAWQLTQASTATVSAIPGFGPKRRAAVRAYLTGHGATVLWEA